MKKDEELSRLLGESKPECAIPADFQAQVWQKIALRADQRGASGFTEFFSRLREQLLEPRLGYSLAVVAVLIGLALGQVQASADARQAWSSLEGKYISSIDPYAQTGHGSHP